MTGCRCGITTLINLSVHSSFSIVCYKYFPPSLTCPITSPLEIQQSQAAGYLSPLISSLIPLLSEAQEIQAIPVNPFVINNRLLSWEFNAFVFFFPLRTSQLFLLRPIIIVCWQFLVQTKAKNLHACQRVGKDCAVALLAHLGHQMMSIPIEIIGLNRKQEGFDMCFIQKYETNYLGSSICLLEKAK